MSPIDGVTGVRLIDPGNLVQTSDSDGLVVITQLDPMTVLFTLPEDDLPRVQNELAKGPLTVEAYSRDGSHDLATGTLTFIDNQINQTTATIRLRASFPNPKSLLWPNEFVKARLTLSTREGRHRRAGRPSSAARRGRSSTSWARQRRRDAARRPPLPPGRRGHHRRGRGSTPGEMVVTDGQNQLKPGSKVAAHGAESKGSPARRRRHRQATLAASGPPPGHPGAAGSSRAP